MASKEYEKLYRELMSRPATGPATIQQLRDGFETWLAGYPPPSDVRFEPFSIGPLPACWAFARNVKRQPLILFFFGGGYCLGSVHSHKGLMGRISQASGYAVLGINYRLAPENPFPAALEDALTAYRWLLHHPYPHNHIALAGTSAGAGLALSLLLRLKLENLPLPAAAVCLCPWVDLTKSYSGSYDVINPERLMNASKRYCGSRDPKDPFISPLYGDLSGLPPLLIQTGTRDLLYDEAVELAKKAKSAKLEKWPEMVHCWQFFAGQIPEGQQALEHVGAFLRKYLAIE